MAKGDCGQAKEWMEKKLEEEMGMPIKLGRLVGEGTYGKVFEGKGLGSERWAVKLMVRKSVPEMYWAKFLPREVSVLRQLGNGRCQALMKVKAVLAKPDMVGVVGELAEGGNLLRYIRRVRSIEESRGVLIIRQLVEGLKFLHANDVAHRDLKLENILLTRDGDVRIADFGFARVCKSLDPLSETFCGSAAYAAPEVLRAVPYKPIATDLWSLGVVVYAVLIGVMPFDDRDIAKLLKHQLIRPLRLPTAHPVITSNALDAIQSLLHPKPHRRPTAENLAHYHPFLKRVVYYPHIPASLALPHFPLTSPSSAMSSNFSSANSDSLQPNFSNTTTDSPQTSSGYCASDPRLARSGNATPTAAPVVRSQPQPKAAFTNANSVAANSCYTAADSQRPYVAMDLSKV